MVSTISISELRGATSSHAQLIDVRSASEYASGHIPGAVNVPMDQIEARLDDLRPDVRMILICQGGTRARMTAALLEPCGRDVAVLNGGTSAWVQAGFPIVKSTKTRWSLERQVRLIAGLLVIAGFVLSRVVHPAWLFLSMFVGLGLTFAGVTDLCLMGEVLGRMPWNEQSHCKVAHPKAEPCPGKQ